MSCFIHVQKSGFLKNFELASWWKCLIRQWMEALRESYLYEISKMRNNLPPLHHVQVLLKVQVDSFMISEWKMSGLARWCFREMQIVLWVWRRKFEGVYSNPGNLKKWLFWRCLISMVITNIVIFTLTIHTYVSRKYFVTALPSVALRNLTQEENGVESS